MNPDVFITIAFVSWVVLIAVVGVAVTRREIRREATARPVEKDSTATFRP